jgi:hypothetical protein
MAAGAGACGHLGWGAGGAGPGAGAAAHLRRAAAGGLVLHLSWLNQASTDVYFAQTLQVWEQGRFIRFYGLAQWLGWLWPYATLIYVGWYVAQRAAAPRMAA